MDDNKISTKGGKNITIYSTPSCHFCHMAKDFFKENNVEFTDKNVAVNRASAEEMVQKSGQMGVPVIDINGEIIIGFDEPRLRTILEIA